VSRPQRLADASYVGVGVYFLTFCTKNREPHFTTRAAVDPVLAQFLRTADDEGFAIRAYCFMPDHVHLLIEGLTEQSDVRGFAKMAKQRSGYVFKQSGGAPLWQEGYVDSVLRSD
jgi:putative transposase